MSYFENVNKDEAGNALPIRFRKNGFESPATVVKAGERFMIDDELDALIIGPQVNPEHVVKINPDTGKPVGEESETADTDADKKPTKTEKPAKTDKAATADSAVGSVADQLNAAK